jgi:dienelactone hydrolase
MNLGGPVMKFSCTSIASVLLLSSLAHAQNTAGEVRGILDKRLQSSTVVTFQLQQFLMKQVPGLPAITTPENWTAEAKRIRERVLSQVVFHGWPQAWVMASPRFEDEGELPSGKGYRLRKLRYEIVPGFYSVALLYTPANLQGQAPAVLDVMGHFYQTGKSEPFEQKLCINQALRGMIALNPEFLDMGELFDKENTHWYGAHLDLVGTNELGLFYLAMRRGLDYLWEHPQVDRKRIAVTGLSGGGWQTIVLSALDERVSLSIPVAGYSTLEGRLALAPKQEAGDLENNPTDLLVGQDYSTLTAIRAPRPTLLINNAEDDCCYRAALVEPYIFEPVRPFFRLYGKEDALQFYEDTSISAHNYGIDNREQAYRFLDTYFGLPASDREIPLGDDTKSYNELAVGLPKDNLTILALARRFAGEIAHQAAPPDSARRTAWAETARSKLKQIVRYNPVTVQQAWAVDNSHHNGVESISFRFLLSNGLSATGAWLKDIPTPAGAPLTIILNDRGKQDAAKAVWDRLPEVANRMDRNEQVLVLDLVFSGDAAPEGSVTSLGTPFYLFPEMIAATGNRPLGLEAAQLAAIANYSRDRWRASSLRAESTGIRSQLEALVAAALSPHLFSELAVQGGMRSLQYMLDKPVSYQEYPDLFCLDLYRDFDVDNLVALAEPTAVRGQNFLEDVPRQD